MITHPRLVDWQERLWRVFDEEATVPFEWGFHDCCTFAAKCVDAQYGTDFLSNFEGTYKTELESKRWCMLRFKTTHLPTIFDLFLTRLDTPKQVQRGDIVIFEGLNGLTAGVFWNNQIWAKGDKGIFTFDMKDSIVVDVWRY